MDENPTGGRTVITDTEMLDWLEDEFRRNIDKESASRVVLRNSTTGRGFRLHSCAPSEWEPNHFSVREAIIYRMKQIEPF